MKAQFVTTNKPFRDEDPLFIVRDKDMEATSHSKKRFYLIIITTSSQSHVSLSGYKINVQPDFTLQLK